MSDDRRLILARVTYTHPVASLVVQHQHTCVARPQASRTDN